MSSKSIGRVRAGGHDRGSAFALSPLIVITAAHVVKNAGGPLEYVPDGEPPVPVDSIEFALPYDSAMLRLSADVHTELCVGRAVKQSRWFVDSRPLPRDARLTGVLDDTERKFEMATVLQLRVDQRLDSYKGYSGSAILLESAESTVVGLLTHEMPYSRLSKLNQDATNILFGIPIGTLVERFDLGAEVCRVDPGELRPGVVRAARESVEKALKDLDTSSKRKRRRSQVDEQYLRELRAALNSLSLALGSTESETSPKYLDQSEKTLLSLLGLESNGVTAGTPNRHWLTTCHFALEVIASLRGDEPTADRHRLYAFELDPHLARTQYYTEYFRQFLSGRCLDIYEEYERSAESLRAKQVFFTRSTALITTGVGLGAVGAAITARTGHAGVGKVVAFTGIQTARMAFDRDFIREEALTSLRRRFTLRLDERCREVSGAALKSIKASGRLLEPAEIVPGAADIVGL